MQQILEQYRTITPEDVKSWVMVGSIHDFPEDGGACVKHGTKQIAVFNFARRMAWYACQNLCPHKFEMVLSRGLTGDLDNEPKVACPLHKKAFSLKSGKNLNGDDLKIATYPVKIEQENVYIGFSD